MVLRKALRGVEVKDAAKGEVKAVFATLDVVDKDGDVTVKGAFKDGAPCVISDWNHSSWQGARPVGKGVIREVGNEAVFEGTFFMNTSHGRDAFETVKGMSEDGGPGCEWSYGFDVLDSEPATKGSPYGADHRRTLKSMKVHEVSPVMIGAGVGTRVLSTKSEKTFAEHIKDVMASVKELRERAADVVAMRAQKGKGLGEESASLLESLTEELKAFESVLKDEPDTKNTETMTDEQRAVLRRIWLNSVRIAHVGE